jgi:hypothetical protein
MSAIEEIFQEASRLSEAERLALAGRILRVDQPEPTEEVARVWDQLIRERIERYDRGETRARPASEVFADLDRRLGS